MVTTPATTVSYHTYTSYHSTTTHLLSVYLDMGAVGTDPSTKAYIEIKLDGDNWSSFNRRWNILASQIECNDNYHAPQGCLQYFAGNDGQGTVEAFNYNNPSSSYIGHLQGETEPPLS